MKKVLFISLFLLLSSKSLFSQETHIRELTNYNAVMDSLLVTLWQQIKVDVAQKGYQFVKLTPDEIEFEGHIMILEVYFNPKVSYILALFGVTNSMDEKFKKQTKGFRFRRQLYSQAFRNYVEENRKIPELYKINYKFIAMYQDSPPDHSVYGKYVFKMNENEKFEIMEREIGILGNQAEFEQKYHSNF
ncbi:MAG: hypothetical protein K9H58_18630 [Bacteroidales bacterium]|nr:hypothetical protein [Bacteroidales bacterium]